MRNRFDRQLHLLDEQLTHMGELCETAIAKATQALKDGSIEQAKVIIAEDEEIDQIEKDIERLCLKLLLQQQPVAKDLRRISAALKMITDMERIGDHAYDIADIVKKNNDLSELVEQLPFRDMVKQTIKMVDDAIQSFVNNDRNLAKQVMDEDDIVDNYFETIYNDLATKGIDRRSLDLLMIAKYYERIGDHATNIAEFIIYVVEGKDIRHTDYRLPADGTMR